MAVNVKAFLAIEKSLAARLERSWRQVSSQYVADLEEAAAQKNWDRAVQIVDSLDLTPIYDKNSQYIRYASMAALMFGMSRLRSHLKSSNALPGLWSGKLLERGGISLRAQIRGPMTDYLREILLKRLGQLEAEDMLAQQESLQKYDPNQPRAPKGSPDGGQWVRLYHGTAADNIPKILEAGFRESTDGAFGPGVYLTQDLKAAQFFGDDVLEVELAPSTRLKEFPDGKAYEAFGMQPEVYADFTANEAAGFDAAIRRALQAEGYSGIRVAGRFTGQADYIVVYDPKGISEVKAVKKTEEKLYLAIIPKKAAKFDPEQPRAPRGSPIGGQWVKGRFYYEGKTRVMHPVSMRTQGAEGGEYEKGQPYKWIYDDGTEVSAADVDRLKKLNVPPAYVNVQLNADIEAPMQAVGTNVKGNVKRFYYSWFHEKNAAEKFSRVQEFDADLDGIRKQILKDLHSPDEKVRAAAEVLYLIDQTGFRVGGDGDTKADKQAFGASTLLASHVRVTGTKVAFSFPSKNGMRTTKTVDNQILADLIERRRAALGNTRGKPLLPGTDDDAREYLKAITGKPYLVKDFRTWHATSEALGYMQKWKTKPRTEKEMKKRRREVVKHVANFIGDTPNMALKYYIDPSVWEWWEPQRDETDDA